MDTVGFIGLERAGAPMAVNIQKAGYPMVVYDGQPESAKPLLEGGARLAGSPAEVARLSDIIISYLPGPKEVEEAVFGAQGILAGIKKGGIYMDITTCGLALTRRILPAFQQKGAHVLDGPINGGGAAAVNRDLMMMVGGEREVYDRIFPVLDAFAQRVIYAGGTGTGYISKLVLHQMAFVIREVIAEGLTLGVKAGVEPQAFLETGEKSILGVWTGVLGRTAFRGEFDAPLLSMSNMLHHIAMATELAREVNVPMPHTSMFEQTCMQAMNRGWGDRDHWVVWLLQEEAAQVQVRV